MMSGGGDSRERVFNFSAGPAVLPRPVLETAQRDLLCLPGTGASVLEISHRSKEFIAILESADHQLRQLLDVPADYELVFLQGGSRLQFSMVPMNLMVGGEQPADYVITGSWGKAALQEAKKVGDVHCAWDGASNAYVGLPSADDLNLTSGAAYVHYTSNETIEGVQFASEPDVGDRPLVCDASSDFLSRPLDISRYGLIYACAQKNAGPSGVTIVIIRRDLLERVDESLPGYLRFDQHVAKGSMFNTPPTFAIYIVDLVAKWLSSEIGGLAAMHDLNRNKAKMLYDVIDETDGFYRGHASADARSLMNVTFRLSSAELQDQFIAEAANNGLYHLNGHRSVGGIRASIYNAMPVKGVEALRDFMQSFWQEHR